MKDPIPILDDDYFERKRAEKKREALRRTRERERERLSNYGYERYRQRQRISDRIDLGIDKVRYGTIPEDSTQTKILRVADTYIKVPEKTAEEFITAVDQLLEGQPYTSCPITKFTAAPTSTDTKRLGQITVGDFFGDPTLMLVIAGTITIVWALITTALGAW